jgi:hypothetical protein
VGYHVEILRTREGQQDPLREEEIRSLAAVMPDAQIAPPSLQGGVLELVIGSSEPPPVRLLLQDGRLWTKNPEVYEIEMMIDVARRLGARVRGDELETYRTPTDTFVHPDDRAEVDRSTSESRRLAVLRRKRRMLFRLIPLTVLAAGVLASMCKRRS